MLLKFSRISSLIAIHSYILDNLQIHHDYTKKHRRKIAPMPFQFPINLILHKTDPLPT